VNKICFVCNNYNTVVNENLMPCFKNDEMGAFREAGYWQSDVLV